MAHPQTGILDFEIPQAVALGPGEGSDALGASLQEFTVGGQKSIECPFEFGSLDTNGTIGREVVEAPRELAQGSFAFGPDAFDDRGRGFENFGGDRRTAFPIQHPAAAKAMHATISHEPSPSSLL